MAAAGRDPANGASAALKYNPNITLFSDRLVALTGATFAPDVVHIQDHYFLSRSVLRMVRQQPIKHIGTNHFLPANLTDNLRLPIWLCKPVQAWLWRNMLAVYNRLDGVTTPTETAVTILKQVGLRVPVQAISCGVDRWHFRPRPELDRTVMRNTYGLHPDKTLLIYVGRVDYEKCLDIVINALATLDRDDLQFVIVGTVWLYIGACLVVWMLGLWLLWRKRWLDRLLALTDQPTTERNPARPDLEPARRGEAPAALPVPRREGAQHVTA